MASKDIINSVDVSNPSNTRRTADLLPNFHRTDRNTKFLASTLDQFIQQPQLKRIDGYVGSKLSPKFDPTTDQYIDGTTKLRNDYQLEPSLIIQDANQNIKRALGYDDLINQLAFNNSKVSNLDRLMRPRSYSYDPMIDWDKFVNFRQYYWMPTGPDVVSVTGQPKQTVSTYTVRDSEDKSSLIFTPDGGTTNPLLTLYRGLTYVFEVSSSYQFYVKTAYVEGANSLYSGTTNNGIKSGQIIVTIDDTTPNNLFYFAEGSGTGVGKFVVKTLEDNTAINVETEILGKKSYTSGNRVTFSNGMKIRFGGTVTPEFYADKEFIVEGVGNSIVLVDYEKLQPAGNETTNLNVNFDSNPFDEYPFDDFRFVPLTPDYITINRASQDQNAWSRYNRWVHSDVIEATAKANGVPVIFPADRRAQRPIIEFNAGLQLFNYGAVGKDNIDLIDTKTTNAFKSVEGTPNHFIDGVQVEAGNRVIFNADTDPLVRGKIYEVKFAIVDNRQYINLEEVLDSDPKLHETVIVKSGNLYKGTAWWFNGDTWQFGQQKTKVNQPPLWELYDKDGIRYSDQSVYKSTFEGTQLFGYELGTIPDSVLGFNVAYRNINNVGEFLFKNFYGTDTFTNFVNGEIVQLNVFDGFLKLNTTSGEVLRTIWTKTVDKPVPILQYQVVTEQSVFIEINSIDNPGFAKDLSVEVFVNDHKKKRNVDYVLTFDGERAYIVSNTNFAVNNRVLIKLYTSQTPNQNGYYEPPANLTNNPLNGPVSNFTFTEISDHVKTIVDFNGEFEGEFPGAGNLRDLGNISQFASRITTHINPLSFAHYFLGSEKNNIIDAVRKVSDDYNQFKLNLMRYVSELRGAYSPDQSLDIALLKLNSTKDNTFNYKNSNMLAYGNDQTTRSYLVTNSRNVRYSLASQFNDTALSDRAILVYFSRVNSTTQQTETRLLIKDYDYEISKFDASITIKIPLLKNDRIVVKDYPNTTGTFIPPTPTKLGLYPKFKPQLYKDTTYIEDRWVIQGHDGSITVAYGNYDLKDDGTFLVNDYRDAVLLEYETRVFNNLKVNYDPELLNIDEVFPGAFRNSGVTQQELTDLISSDFLRWAGFYGVDYQTNSSLDELDSFTFNYSSNIDSLSKNRLTGFWRSVYKYFYDTDRPHTHPWEMLGFREEPNWWKTTYGPAPYTSGNTILWQDLEAGRIAVTASGPVINTMYARPGLSNIIPVDGHGNLLSPTDSGLATTPIVNLNDPQRLIVLRTDQISAKWKVGDHGPAETAWRRSSFWPFACQIVLALSKPATYASLMFDPSRIKKNVSGEYRYGDNLVFLNPSKVAVFNDVVNGDRVLASGYSQFVIETGTTKDSNYIANLKLDLENLDYRLMAKLGGFASKDKLSVGIDAVDPSSPYPGLLIPSEDYEIFFSQSTPIESLSVSGIIVQKTNNGWAVRGYDKYRPYFTVFKPFPSNIDQTERVGGVSESFSNWVVNTTYQEGQIVFFNDRYYRVLQRHNSDESFNSIYYQSLPYLPIKGGVGVFRRSVFDNTETVVPYGTEFTTIQEVYDFIIGYGKWLGTKGFVFEEFNTDLDQILDWSFTAKEFLYWTTQNWSVNSVITLSPFANKLIFRSNTGVVESIADNFYEYSLLKADGSPFPKNNFTVVRLDGEFVLSTINTLEGLFFARINVVQKEHVLVMNNFTLFNDVIYDVELGYRQRRLKLKGFITKDWNGDFFSPGFVFDQAVVKDWQKFTDYRIGDVVRFSGSYYSAIKSIPGSESFDITKWAVLNEKPSPQLLPNFDYKINQFEDFYSLDIDNFDVAQQAMAQNLIGYNPRPYLNFIIGDPIAQYKFYQGFIREKGTRKAIDSLSKSSLNSFRTSVNFNEEWAFRIGYYGGFNTYQELETSLEYNKFVENPQIIEFVSDKPVAQDTNIYYKDFNDVLIKPENFDISKVFSTVDVTLEDNNFKLPVAGYVRFDDVTATAYNKNSVLDIANNASLKTGSTIWLGFKEDGQWDVLRVTDVPTFINAVAINVPGQSITLTTFYAHQLQVNDLISVVGISPDIDQCYVITQVLNDNQFVVLSTLTILPDFENTLAGKLFVFKSSRLSTFDDLSRIPFLDRWANGEKVWVDNNGEDKWVVYRKNNNFNSRTYPGPSSVFSDNQHYGQKFVVEDIGNNASIVLVSAPDQERFELTTPLWGKVYVLFRDTLGDTLVLSEFSLNEENSYHGTSVSNETSFGSSLAFNRRTNLAVVGAPKVSDVRAVFAGTNEVNPAAAVTTVTEQGVVKLLVLDQDDLEPFNILSFPDSIKVITTPTLSNNANFGNSILLSSETIESSTVTNFSLLVGAPGNNNSGTVYKFEITVTTGTAQTIDVNLGVPLATNVSVSAPSLLTAGSQFGSEIAASEDLSRIAVSAPGFVNTSSGAIFVYTSTYVHQVITGDIDDLGSDLLSESDQFATKIKMSKDGSVLVAASPFALDKAYGIRSGVVDVFQWKNSKFERIQRISAPISALTNTTKFGWDIDLNDNADTLVITSLGTSKSVKPTFDFYSERYSTSTISQLFGPSTSIYVNDPSSLPRKSVTTFDGGSTTFTSRNQFSGTAHVYNRLGTGSTQYAYAEPLISRDINEESAFGYSIVAKQNAVYVGAPGKPLENETFSGFLNGKGQFFVFDKIDQAQTSWQLYRTQEPSVDLTPIGRAITINTDTEQIQNYIDVIDPIKGSILGSASEELRYITPYDPAVYSVGINGVNVNPNTNWLDEHVGELWWDLSTVKYVWYEQGELEYRKNNWNNIFPGSSIDVYEWVRSEYLPIEWAQLADTAEGLTRGISGQPKFIDNSVISVKQVYNSVSNAFTNVYYFWVKNKTTVPSNISNRAKPAFEIAQMIADPVGSGSQFLAVLSPTSVMLANAKSLVSTEKINLNMSFDLITDSANRHTEWLLLQENDANSKPNWLLEKKLVDSLLGRDSLGNPVPDPALPSKLRYGVEVRPRQGLFVDRFEALRNIIEYTNDILRTQLITGSIDFTDLNAVEELPNEDTYDSIVEDIFTLELISTKTFATAKIRAVANNDGQISSIIIDNPGFGYITPPTITINGTGSGAELTANLNQFGAITSVSIVKPGENYSSVELVVRPYTTVVQADTNSGGKWAVYEWDDVKKVWIKTRTQSYNTAIYWKYIDWSAPTYDPLKNIVSTVASVYALEVIESLAEDSYVKVKNGGDGRYIIVRRTNGQGGSFDQNWDLVYSERGTIQFLDTIWNISNSLYAWDKSVGWDQTQYDQAPDKEIEFILKAIKDNIFVDTLKIYWNQIFFKAVRYAMSEQKFLDWAFKTTFINVTNNFGSLDQPPSYKLKNDVYYEEFLNELKPYHTKIRKFTQQYTATELTNTFNTDFDLPAYYNTTTLNFNKVEFGNDLLLQYPWKSWYDNYTYVVETIELYDNGDGYTQIPQVTIITAPGDSGFGATAVAYISAGRVTQIVVTNPGQGYTTTPTVVLSGGGDTALKPARAYARLGGSPVRINSIRMKFDRVSTSREIGTQYFTDRFVGDGFDVSYPLTWVPVADKTEITVTCNGLLCLIDSYTIVYETAKFNPQENTEYSKKYAILSLNFIPALGDIIKITYPKSLDLYTAADRIEDYYQPGPGMPGKDLNQLMTGVEYSGLIVEGLPFNFSGGWDTIPWASTAWDNFGVEEGYTTYSTTTAFTTQTYSIPTIITTGTEVNVYLKSAVDISSSGKRIDNANFDNYRGEWSSLIAYTTTDVVLFNDTYYQAQTPVASTSTGIVPSSTSSWKPVQYSENVVMTTLIGNGTGAVDTIQVLVPGAGYNAQFTSLAIAPPNTVSGTQATGTLEFKAIDARVTTTTSGYSVGDVLVAGTPYGTATLSVSRVTPTTGTIVALTVVDGGTFVGTTPQGDIVPTSTVVTPDPAIVKLTYGVSNVVITSAGSGYTEPPAITIVESINTSNSVASVSVPAFARAFLRAEFRAVNSTTTLSHLTVPAVAFTTTSSLVILRYADSDGTITPTDPDSLDALIDGGNLNLTNALGVNPSEIILDGGSQATRHITGMMDDGFLNTINSPAPEECVPGQIQESLGISVYTQPPTISPIISTKQYWYNGSKLTFKLGIKPTSQSSVVVVYNRQRISQLQNANPSLPPNYTIDYQNNTVTFASGALTGSGWLSVTALQPGSLTLLDSVVQTTTVTNTVIKTGARYSDVGSSYVTLNGITLTQNLSTSASAVLAPTEYQILKNRGRAEIKVQALGVVQAYLFNGTDKSFSEIYEQERVLDEVISTEEVLQRPPGVAAPYHSQIIVSTSRGVDKNRSRLRPPVTTYYQAVAGQRFFDISQTKVYPKGNIGSGDLEVYVNGVQVTGGTAWVLNQPAGQLEFATGYLKNNDVIAIVILRDYDYVVRNDRVILTTPLVTGDTISVITFTNHDPDFIRTDRFDANASGQYTMQRAVLDSSYVWVTFNGKPLIANVDYAIENNNRTVIIRDGLYTDPQYQNETVLSTYEVFETIGIDATSATNYVTGDVVFFGGAGWAQPAAVELLVTTATNAISVARIIDRGIFTATVLPTGPLTPTGITINPYVPFHAPEGIRMSFNFRNTTQYPTPTVLVTSFADVVPLVGYRLFRDMLGRTHYKRLSGQNTTVLAQDFYLRDSYIVVEDASVLTVPNPQYNRPGVVFIDGERIEFFVIQGNVLSQLRRSTLGTGPKDVHYAGVQVVDQGSNQTIPFKEEIQRFTTSTTATTTFSVEISNIEFSDSANYWDQVEVRYAGTPLLKPGLSTVKHDFTVAYDSNETNTYSTASDAVVFHQFTITNGTNILEIYPERIEGYQPGRRIEVIRRTSRSWYDSTSTSLSKSGTVQAKFLTEKPAAIPPFMSSSTYVAVDLTLYLDGPYGIVPLLDENDNPLEGI